MSPGLCPQQSYHLCVFPGVSICKGVLLHGVLGVLQSTMMHTQHGWDVLCCLPNLWAVSTGSIGEEEHLLVPGGRLGEIRRAHTSYQELTSTDWEAAIAGSHLHLREEGHHQSRHMLSLWTQEDLARHRTPICLHLEASSSPAGICPCYPELAAGPRSSQNSPQNCKAVDSWAPGCRDLAGALSKQFLQPHAHRQDT